MGGHRWTAGLLAGVVAGAPLAALARAGDDESIEEFVERERAGADQEQQEQQQQQRLQQQLQDQRQPPRPNTPPGEKAELSEAELDQLLAPIALYPDPLLAQVLIASTYPLEVASAALWLKEGDHRALEGEKLTKALTKETWDASVKSLVPFPRVLETMASDLGWVQRLGDAVLTQREDVMASVQRLRQRSKDAGKLQSTNEFSIGDEGGAITIEPVQRSIVYVPYYDPYVAYGAWPWAYYPPYWFPTFGVGVGFGVGFGGGVALGFGWGFGVPVTPYWGWCGFNWQHRVIAVDPIHLHHIAPYASVGHVYGARPYVNQRFVPHGPVVAAKPWVPDPVHRHGVPVSPIASGAVRPIPSQPPTAFRGTPVGRTPTGRVVPPAQGRTIPRSSAPYAAPRAVTPAPTPLRIPQASPAPQLRPIPQTPQGRVVAPRTAPAPMPRATTPTPQLRIPQSAPAPRVTPMPQLRPVPTTPAPHVVTPAPRMAPAPAPRMAPAPAPRMAPAPAPRMAPMPAPHAAPAPGHR